MKIGETELEEYRLVAARRVIRRRHQKGRVDNDIPQAYPPDARMMLRDGG